MKRAPSFSSLLLLGALTTVLYGVAGCGGGGGTSTQNALLKSRAELQQLAAGKKPTSERSLQSLFDLFLLAIQQDPNSSEANFGAAICLAGVVAQQADSYTGNVDVWTSNTNGKASNTANTGDVDKPPTPIGRPEPASIPPHHVRGLFWNIDAGLTNPYSLLHTLAPLADLRGGLMAFYGYGGDDAARRLKMLDRLDTVAQYLTKVEADPNFSVTLSLPTGQPLIVGLPEVFLFDAYVQSLRAEIALSLAYIRDPGSDWYPPIAYAYITAVSNDGTITGGGPGSPGNLPANPVRTPSTLDKNKDGKLTPEEYLPPSPYLTLRDATLLTKAQQALLLIVEKETKGIEGVFARPADGAYLVPNSTEMHNILADVQTNVLPLITQATTGPVKIDVPVWNPSPMTTLAPGRASRAQYQHKTRKVFDLPSNSAGNDGMIHSPVPLPEIWPEIQYVTLTIDLSAWFTHPPVDLKVFAPTLTLNSDGWPDESLTAYPDLTFGGLFPDGFRIGLPF